MVLQQTLHTKQGACQKIDTCNFVIRARLPNTSATLDHSGFLYHNSNNLLPKQLPNPIRFTSWLHLLSATNACLLGKKELYVSAFIMAEHHLAAIEWLVAASQHPPCHTNMGSNPIEHECLQEFPSLPTMCLRQPH